jgi:hypothetical protein
MKGTTKRKATISFLLLSVIIAFSLTFISAAEWSENSSATEPENLEFLEQEAQRILDDVAGRSDIETPNTTESSVQEPVAPPSTEHIEPPAGASHHLPVQEAEQVSVGFSRTKRSMKKAAPKGSADFNSNSTGAEGSPEEWRKVSFSSGSFAPPAGSDPYMTSEISALKASGRDSVYGFILMDEYLCDATRQEIEALGVTILGPHSSLYKAKFPLDEQVIESVVALPYVEWVGYSLPEQKLSRDLEQIMAQQVQAARPAELPVYINLFDDDPDETFKGRLEAAGAVVGKYDSELRSYRAVASPATIEQIILLDFVLFVELIRQTNVAHDQSMSTIGADYIRAHGTSYDGDSTDFGIMDTGFMLGGSATTMHRDLNTNGCGYSEVTGEPNVWNDQNGHGTHVLGTVCGTGTADDRYRGVAMGVGQSGEHYIRAVKIWDKSGFGSSTWMENAMDFFDDEFACGEESKRPQVINVSGGAGGMNLVGTDSTSRKLDEKVWTYDQVYVVAAMNNGPGNGTIGTPAVAKNALTVGNVYDYGHLTVGDINDWNPFGSSRGPTGDGRMKPNVVGPGTWVTSARAGYTSLYEDRFGTSMATPHVSGLVASLMEHYTHFKWRPALLRAAIMATSILHDDTTIPDSNDSGGRNIYGLGRVSSFINHWSHGGSAGWYTHWFTGTVTNTTYMQQDIEISSGTDRLVVVMTWDEPAASAGASKAVMYDLDLWADWNCDHPSSWRGDGGEYASRSYVDNVEYLIINNPPAGCFRLKASIWNAPASGLPVGMAAFVLRGDPTPAMSMTATPSTTTPPVGSTFTVSTTVSNPSYVASGVHVSRTSASGGLTPVGFETTREDGVVMDFWTGDSLTLGNIRAADSRSIVWKFKADTPGEKTISFRAWSENGGTVNKSATVTVGSAEPVADIKANGSDGPITISSATNLIVTVELDPGDRSGDNADWWVLAAAGGGTWYYYSLSSGDLFYDSVTVTIQ